MNGDYGEVHRPTGTLIVCVFYYWNRWGAIGTVAFLLVVLLGVQGRPNVVEWGKSFKHLVMRSGKRSEFVMTLGSSLVFAL